MNNKMIVGSDVILHSYKHDKTLHRVWKTETLLENNDELIIVANKRTRVVESNGRFWYTKEPSVSFFFKNHWFNVIGIIKGDKVNYYCNMSSPILYDDEAMKYIDYDLDLKVDHRYDYHILDSNEYQRNQELMNYPDEIKKIIILEMNILKDMVENREFPFQKEVVMKWYKKYRELKGDF